MIGERELRRLLSEHLQLRESHLNIFIDSLRTQDQSQLFRRFMISEVEEQLQRIATYVPNIETL